MYGDQILADLGFNVQEAVGLYCAEIVTPPFTREKKQLSRLEIDQARNYQSMLSELLDFLDKNTPFWNLPSQLI